MSNKLKFSEGSFVILRKSKDLLVLEALKSDLTVDEATKTTR